MIYKNLFIFIVLLASTGHAEKSDVKKHVEEVATHLIGIKISGVNNPVSVGNEPSCDFSSIQAAIDSGADEVRLTDKGKPYFENVEIIDNSVALKGNYANCNDASNDITSDVLAVVDGGHESSVLTIENKNSNSQHAIISHLIIQNGIDLFGGGININNNKKIFVYLDQVRIRNNHAELGGGVHVVSSDNNGSEAHLVIKDSVIENNIALYSGGGLRAYSDKVKVLIDGDTSINNNTSTRGGGVEIAGFTRLTLFSPVIITRNKSLGDAGGLLLSADFDFYGKQICELGYCFGSNSLPISIVNNIADADHSANDGLGGGIMVSNINDSNEVNNVLFKGNSALLGGAFFVDYNNRNQGTTTFNTSRFELNRADFGTVGVIIGSDDVKYDPNAVNIQNSLINNNGAGGAGDFLDNHLFYIYNRSTLNMTSNTIADNDVIRSDILSQGKSVMTVMSSNIVDESVQLFIGSPDSQLFIDCLLVKNAYGLPQAIDIQVADASFVDAASGNYHLNADSPAIDFCGPDLFANQTDYEGKSRGYDVPSVENLFGDFDLGAYEYIGK